MYQFFCLIFENDLKLAIKPAVSPFHRTNFTIFFKEFSCPKSIFSLPLTIFGKETDASKIQALREVSDDCLAMYTDLRI